VALVIPIAAEETMMPRIPTAGERRKYQLTKHGQILEFRRPDGTTDILAINPTKLIFMVMSPLDQVAPEMRPKRIFNDIVEAIAEGRIRPDDEIPSWDVLTGRYRTDPDDVLRALSELRKHGLTTDREGGAGAQIEHRDA
jgi:hypothetical protein